ncbi:enoyl-CoA hydratase/isomerase family protein [Nocardia elegans]|uniref:Enoyl-CoA hydratase/isomerase family protein n=1 Tax=Nocardia elegans TaxID=300029 RepID=A0ABW6T741_9NOCA|nr:enoyl-CoA hydratase/isomerase family protein [Nocardia elegans]MBF6446693.1 enoyl-CoA hydratase/isomerase family protein [Nocardia elegans]
MSVTLSRTGAVGVLTLDRPPVNAFDEGQAAEFATSVAEFGADPAVRAVVVRSAAKVFCAGADIAMMDSWRELPDRGVRLEKFCLLLQNAFAALAALEKPTIAEISGAATGGGFELALACDFRVARATAKIGLPEVGIGLLPGAGGTQRLTRLVGPATAYRLILGAELIDATTAERLGLVHWAVDDAAATAMTLAERLADLPADAYTAAKRCIDAAGTGGGYGLERTEIGALIYTEETGRRLDRFVSR